MASPADIEAKAAAFVDFVESLLIAVGKEDEATIARVLGRLNNSHRIAALQVLSERRPAMILALLDEEEKRQHGGTVSDPPTGASPSETPSKKKQ